MIFMIRRNKGVRKEVYIHRGVLVGILAAFLLGIILGCILTNRIADISRNEILLTIKNIVYNIDDTTPFKVFIKTFSIHFIYIFLIWMLGLTLIGIPLIIFIDFFKGFLYGFVVTFFLRELGIKGLYTAFLYTFPQNIIIVPLFLVLSYFSIYYSVQIYNCIYVNHNKKNIKAYFNSYYRMMFITTIILIVYSGIVTLINPYVYKYMIDFM